MKALQLSHSLQASPSAVGCSQFIALANVPPQSRSSWGGTYVQKLYIPCFQIVKIPHKVTKTRAMRSKNSLLFCSHGRVQTTWATVKVTIKRGRNRNRRLKSILFVICRASLNLLPLAKERKKAHSFALHCTRFSVILQSEGRVIIQAYNQLWTSGNCKSDTANCLRPRLC